MYLLALDAYHPDVVAIEKVNKLLPRIQTVHLDYKYESIDLKAFRHSVCEHIAGSCMQGFIF